MIEDRAPGNVGALSKFIDAELRFATFTDERVGGIKNGMTVPRLEFGTAIGGDAQGGHFLTLSATTHKV